MEGQVNKVSGDLISRKVLIADMKSRKYIDKALCEIFETVVDEAPTAFDKEKVIEELRSEASRWHESGVEFKDEKEKGVAAGFRLATHIVEKGGIE